MVIMMIDGLIFFWLGWFLWIIVTFLIRKSKQRTNLACWILLTLLCSNIYFTIESYHISLTFLILLGGAILLLARLPRFMYHIFISFTIMIGYAAMLLWEKNTPVWLFLPRFILIPLISVIMINMLARGVHNRLVTGLLGISAGELIYSIILSGYDLQEAIGEMGFLDNLMVTIVLIVFLDILQKGKYKLLSLLTYYKTINDVAK